MVQHYRYPHPHSTAPGSRLLVKRASLLQHPRSSLITRDPSTHVLFRFDHRLAGPSEPRFRLAGRCYPPRKPNMRSTGGAACFVPPHLGYCHYRPGCLVNNSIFECNELNAGGWGMGGWWCGYDNGHCNWRESKNLTHDDHRPTYCLSWKVKEGLAWV